MAQGEEQTTSSLRPISPRDFGFEHARALLWRAGFGGTSEQIRTLADWGPAPAVEHLLGLERLHYEREEDFDDAIMLLESNEARREYRRALEARDEEAIAKFRTARVRAQRTDRRQVRAMQRWWLARMIETPKPLEEKLALFWHGHFATNYRKIENSHHLLVQNRLFRAQAAGSFGTLLNRIIRDPAMLAYLDNHRSRKSAPNENLARELMELFSLGVGAYTERDIKEGARALTGYTFDGNEFVFRDAWHDQGPKAILSLRGNLDGDDFVRAILKEQACSEFICAKLYGFFVAELPIDLAETPTPAKRVIERLAAELRRARYELRPVLRRLFLSEHFYETALRDGMVKSPAELVVGMIRSLETPVRDLGVLVEALALMGQDLFFPPNVAGWNGGRSWITTSTLFARQNTATYLLTGRAPGGVDPRAADERFDAELLLADLRAVDAEAARDPARVARHLLETIIGRPPGGASWEGAERLGVIERFFHEHGGRVTRDTLLGAATLITAAPEYQLC